MPSNKNYIEVGMESQAMEYIQRGFKKLSQTTEQQGKDIIKSIGRIQALKQENQQLKEELQNLQDKYERDRADFWHYISELSEKIRGLENES